MTGGSWIFSVLAGVAYAAAPVFARPAHNPLQTFRGQWAGGGAHCKWPEEFLYVFDGGSVRTPFQSDQEPDRSCRVLSVKADRPFWKLRLSCNHSDPKYRLPKPFETGITLRVSDDRYRMTMDLETAFGQPARTKSLRFCREVGEDPPPMTCLNDKGERIDCPP